MPHHAVRCARVMFWLTGQAVNPTRPRTVASAPQGFLTSVLQGYSRSNMIPVDQRLSDKQMTDGLGMFGVCGWFTMQAATMFNVLLCKLQWEIL